MSVHGGTKAQPKKLRGGKYLIFIMSKTTNAKSNLCTSEGATGAWEKKFYKNN